MKTHEATLNIPPDSAAIRDARRFAERFLRDHGVQEVADTVVLLVSELVTNAILHSGAGAELRLSLSGSTIRVAVRDNNASPPAVKHYSDLATTGRGMLIVETLAKAWGTEADNGGKVVWFTVTAPSRHSDRLGRQAAATSAGAGQISSQAARRTFSQASGRPTGRMQLHLVGVCW